VGKTTRAVGLAIRAAGRGVDVDFIQFMKSGDSGEVEIFRRISNLHYFCPGDHPFILSAGPKPVHFAHAQQALAHALKAAENGHRLMVCDEILDTILFHILSTPQLLQLATRCRQNHVELVMTGRSAPPELIEAADYMTEMVQRKHPYYQGANARRGLEY
jgi:cob(I)alamin adenosyltransferase